MTSPKNGENGKTFTKPPEFRGFIAFLGGNAVYVEAGGAVSVLMHPERFWERTNAALRCASCTDKLCTQYCPRKKK